LLTSRYLRFIAAILSASSLALVLLTNSDLLLAQSASTQRPGLTTLIDPAAIKFANQLIKQMTLEEKIGQMSQIAMNTADRKGVEVGIRQGKVGSLLFLVDPVEVNRLQKVAVDESRLHIPLIVGFDVIHGFRTIYPVPLAMAASWNPAVVETAQRMAAREASSVGIRWTFAPMVDIARDPRWGRIMEGAGEDPYLGSRMAEAQVHGFQGTDLANPDSILACVKHFAGYGAALGGRDYDSANISDDQLWNVYLPPYKAAVDAGAGSLMTAYMDLNSIPASANSFLLRDVLRGKWKFKGFVVSDWGSVKSLTTHGFSANDHDAAVRAVNAGVEMEMTSHVYRDELASAIQHNEVKVATIDDAVRDILVAKYRLGLFSHPYVDVARSTAELISPAQRAASRLSATQTAVLLRNEGDLLPLRKPPASIAVIGPLADSKADTMGSWSLAGHPSDTVTVLAGIRNRFASTTEIGFTTGVEIERVQRSIFDAQFASPKPTLKTAAERKTEFDHAIALVQSSELTVMVLGEAQSMSGERASRSSLSLPGEQQALLEAAVATGKPIILILVNGRPLDITWATQHVPAILEVWYPGTEGGNAVADLLSGAANPGGKLPLTWPRTLGQIPIYYADNLTQIPDHPNDRYWDGSSAPLYPFGFGLSYSKFTIANLKAEATAFHLKGQLPVSIDLENTTDVPGDEVVQLYTHQRSGSASRPVRELKNFHRIHLNAHEKQTVTLTLKSSDLSFWSPLKHEWVTEPGNFDLWIGNSVQAEAHTQFTLLP
jgi:beta-glucosidase